MRQGVSAQLPLAAQTLKLINIHHVLMSEQVVWSVPVSQLFTYFYRQLFFSVIAANWLSGNHVTAPSLSVRQVKQTRCFHRVTQRFQLPVPV